ncbi:MAG: xanthine dehydrogenase family protein subunit M [Parvularculales bacterium]
MYGFSYRRATSLEEAVRLLAETPESKLLAGGQTLIPTLKQRLAAPECLIDIGRIAELETIRAEGEALVIGACARHNDVATHAEVQRLQPALAELVTHIGDPHVRNKGTLGGSIANNDPAADYPAACLALDAKIHTNHRIIDAGEFFTGLFETALEDNEIITHVTFPHPARAAYMKFPNPASRYAMAGVFVAQGPDGVRVAVTGAGADGVFRAHDMEQALTANWSPEVVATLTPSPDLMTADIHGDATYRAHLITVMAKRAVAATL